MTNVGNQRPWTQFSVKAILGIVLLFAAFFGGMTYQRRESERIWREMEAAQWPIRREEIMRLMGRRPTPAERADYYERRKDREAGHPTQPPSPAAE